MHPCILWLQSFFWLKSGKDSALCVRPSGVPYLSAGKHALGKPADKEKPAPKRLFPSSSGLFFEVFKLYQQLQDLVDVLFSEGYRFIPDHQARHTHYVETPL